MFTPLPKIVSFVVMAALVFIFATLAGSTVGESEDAIDSSWSLHWINLHRHFDIHRGAGVYSVERVDVGRLVIFVLVSIGLTWILSKLLARFRMKRGQNVA